MATEIIKVGEASGRETHWRMAFDNIEAAGDVLADVTSGTSWRTFADAYGLHVAIRAAREYLEAAERHLEQLPEAD